MSHIILPELSVTKVASLSWCSTQLYCNVAGSWSTASPGQHFLQTVLCFALESWCSPLFFMMSFAFSTFTLPGCQFHWLKNTPKAWLLGWYSWYLMLLLFLIKTKATSLFPNNSISVSSDCRIDDQKSSMSNWAFVKAQRAFVYLSWRSGILLDRFP